MCARILPMGKDVEPNSQCHSQCNLEHGSRGHDGQQGLKNRTQLPTLNARPDEEAEWRVHAVVLQVAASARQRRVSAQHARNNNLTTDSSAAHWPRRVPVKDEMSLKVNWCRKAQANTQPEVVCLHTCGTGQRSTMSSAVNPVSPSLPVNASDLSSLGLKYSEQ